MAEENVTGNIKVQSTNEFNNVLANLSQYIFISFFKLCNQFCYFFYFKIELKFDFLKKMKIN